MPDLEEALSELETHQTQLDMDGVMIGVSRQALDILITAARAGLAGAGERQGAQAGALRLPGISQSRLRLPSEPQAMSATTSGTADPKPGTRQASELDCTCPVLDNGHGRGYMGDGERYGFVVQENCPLHAIEPVQKAHELPNG